MMRISMVMCQPTQPLIYAPPTGPVQRDLLISRRQKEKVVVILGATGTGKSRLSIDIASCFPSEIVNSDKIQAHRGLDIVTNKISKEEQYGVPHHLLGTIHPDMDFTAENFCHVASPVIQSISSRGALPIIAGGSNSYIEALVTDPKYDCCFLWVDVAMPVLHKFVSDRVDKMVRNGMVEEVRQFFNPNGDYSKGVRKAIGVPELDPYFRSQYGRATAQTQARLLEEAIEEIKNNTCDLASKQLQKIHRFRTRGWNLHRLDATEVFLKGRGREEAGNEWEETVSGPAAMIVAEFLYNVRASKVGPFEAIRGPNSIEQTIAL